MNFKKNESATKLRGGYYTPEAVSRFLAKWVLQKKPKTILEPSCGDGSFIRALKGQHRHAIHFTGVELHEEEADKAASFAAENKHLRATVKNEDFLAMALEEMEVGIKYEAILGNPPYIRYQYLEPADQLLSEKIFARHSLPFTKHTNAWVPFVIASIDLLMPGGRLAMVIPSELLHVLHAASLRKHLLKECNRIFMMDPNELLFDEALQGTVLLMVEKKKKSTDVSKGVAVTSVAEKAFLEQDPSDFFDAANYVSGDVLNGKWMKVLLEPEELRVFEKVKALPTIRRFADVADVDVGIVTGANKFFLVDAATVRQYGLKKYAHPMFGRSEHCPGIVYNKETHKSNVAQGLPSSFILFNNTPVDKLPQSIQTYIAMGEAQGLHTRYKCRIRKPWYVVPSIYATPMGMLKRSHHFPRLIFNSAGAYTTDTSYRIKTITDGVTAEQLVYGFVNSLTALTAELEGRHYGGGVLELVPSEIEKLLIPIPQLDHFDLDDLDKRVRSSDNPEALLRQQDRVVLAAAGLTKDDIETLHKAWCRIRTRRHRLLVQNDKQGEVSDE
ncbi:MAG: N-6 DNA methylase [Azonexus sp.]